jgi:hypothetical protein
MSNLIFPAPQIQTGWNWKFPIKKSPLFSTIVQTPISNRAELRISTTPNPIYLFDYDLSYLKGDFQTPGSGLLQIIGFYNAVGGAADDWLYQDPYDNALSQQLIGYGDGSTTQFQLGRSLGYVFEMLQNVFPSNVKIAGVTVPAGPQASGNYWYSGLENLLSYSQDFENSVWALANATDSADSIVAPDGSTTADAITFSVSGTSATINQVLRAYPGQPITFSVWMKASSGSPTINLLIETDFGGGPIIVNQSFTLTTSWTRYSVTATMPPTSKATLVYIYNPSSTTPTYHLWGAQLERWSSATSYTVTTNNAPVRPLGLLSFASAPASGAAITSDLSYYYRCRFMEDQLTDLQETLWQIWELSSLKFKSIIL